MGRHSSYAGQLTFDFVEFKNQQKETIKYPDVPKVRLLFDENDVEAVKNFKSNFAGVEYKTNYSDKVDYSLVFLSRNSLMNENLLGVFFDTIDESNNGEFIGLIIDDELRRMDERLKLYGYYHKKVMEICDFKKNHGSNADVRRCGDIFERAYEKMGGILEEIMMDEKNKKISPEDRFEERLKNDGKNEFRIRRHVEGINESGVKEDIGMKTKNEYNNCKIVNAGKDNQIIFNEDSENCTTSQRNGIETDELKIICEAIAEGLRNLNDEDKKELQNKMEELRKEYYNTQNSKDNRLTKCLKLIVPMLTIANGTPTLLQNLQNLQSFLISNIM